MAVVIGRPYQDVIAVIGSPFVAALFVLLFVSVAIHMRIGMQVIIEDYVHDELTKFVTLMANTFFSFAVGLAAIFAILKLSFGL